jgi:GNAT superfamily N-acetyltransferase
MDTTTTRTDEITATLPKGYRAREFRETDREPMVAERNEQVHELQRGSADEWREWEELDPPKDLFRFVVETPDGAPAASAEIGPGFMPRPDGALAGDVGIMRKHRGKGLGTALLKAVEAEAARRKAPRIMAGISVAFEGSLEWAQKRGYAEIGRRIESYVDVRTFDPAPFADMVDRVRDSGITLVTLTEHFKDKDDAARDAFWHELWEAEAPMWEDVPWSDPRPHWPYERFHQLAVKSGKMVEGATVVAFDGSTIAGFTTTGKQGTDRGYTWMTGTGRDHRGRGIATAMKVVMLAGAREAGLRAMLTTNDEPNKAMRGINAKLGYVMLPAHVELEKKL